MGLRSTIRNLRKTEQERDYWKMRFEALQNREENGSNWRLRYETLVERNVQLEEELRKIYSNEMSIEDFHPNGRMDMASTFFIASTTSNGNCSNGGNLIVSQPIINPRRVNAIISGNNNGASEGDNCDLDEDPDDESDFEDDSEGAGVGGFLPMIEGPVAENLSFTESTFNPTNFLKIKCEVQEEKNNDGDDNPEEEEDDDDEEIEIKMNDYETNSNPTDNNTSSSSTSNNHLNGFNNLTNINMIKNDIDGDVVSSMIDYEALRNCLAKDARQCPVCPRICSQRNSTVRHLIEVHHLDRSELMIRKFHKGYHFANFSK